MSPEKEAGAKDLFYFLVRLGDVRSKDRFFVLKQADANTLVREYSGEADGFNWMQAFPYEDKWDALPVP